MDSLVIVDAAPKLGREIDLDCCSFPGFPFDDDADVFDRPRSDGIRAHLDDLAARHPEFAEHLRGPPWPFGGSLLRDRRRRRDSGGSNNDDQQQQGQQHQDEDARSQASGSSAASAASGASTVSSHSGGGGEHDLTSSSAIPQYGLRNTVDIGQQQRRRDMETSPEKGERGQRSMSAPPPESWQQQQSQQQGQDQAVPQPGQGQRFVSRVDITPQHNQQRAQSPGKPSGNVRHIPIFVEGRDVPVMPKVAADDAPPSTFQHHHQRQPSPPTHHFDRSSPPAHHFHRPSHFNERFSRQQWPPSHFQDTFYKPAGFEQPMRRNQFQQQHQQPQYQPHYQQPHQQQPQYHHQPQYQPQEQPQEQHHQQTQQSQYQEQQQQQEIPKSKPPVPKDPLEKVAQVQKDVDDLAEQVQRYVGGSRQDKEYIYLDEMLTRELIKLDDIETEGRENVRQARKNAIKSIQDTIGLLETKTPIVNQQKQQLIAHKEIQECAENDQRGEEILRVPEPMEIDTKQEKQSNEPIPLPPAPSSPTKTKVKSSESESVATTVETANQSVVPASQQDTEQKTENLVAENTEQPVAPMSTDGTKHADETSKESKPNDDKDGEQQKDGDVLRTTTEKATSKQQMKEAIEGKTEVNGQRSSTESPRLQKKAKKTKKKEQQQPVSEQAIPLPPPPTESAK